MNSLRATVLCLLLCGPAAAQARDADSPAAERATFTVADGFDVELFASEADGVVKPSAKTVVLSERPSWSVSSRIRTLSLGTWPASICG